MEPCVGTVQRGSGEGFKWGVCSGVLGLYREGQVRALIGVQQRAAKFVNNINDSVWETLVQRRLIA